jgi:HEAT repeat protein
MKRHVLWVAGILAMASIGAAEPAAKTLAADAARYESGADMTAMRGIERLVIQSAGNAELRGEVEGALIGLLGDASSYEAKRFACQQLAIIGSERSVPALTPLLKDQQTVGIACYALVASPSPTAGEALRSALAGASGLVRVQILLALGNRRDAEAVPALIGLAGDADGPTANVAAAALGRIGTPQAVAALRKMNQNVRAEVAAAVTEGLLYAADRLIAAGDASLASAIYRDLQKSDRTDVRRAALGGLLRLDADGGRARIIEVLAGTDASLRPVAINGVRRLKGQDVSKAFAAQLPQLPLAKQAMLLEALADRGDADARAAMAAHVAAEDIGVRIAAITGLGKLGDQSAVPVLARALATAAGAEEFSAAEQALVGLRGGDSADRAIVSEMEKSQGLARNRLVTVLGRRNSRIAMPALVAATGDADTGVARAAFDVLARLGTADELGVMIDQLIATPSADVRRSAEAAILRVLVSIDEPAKRTAIVGGKLASAPNTEARIAIIRLLPTAGDAQALAMVQRLVTDADPAVRDAAVRALADWRDLSAWDALMVIYERPASETHRVLALRGLVRLATETNAKGGPERIDRYRRLLVGAHGDNDQKLILGALSGVAHPDALTLALPLLSNAAVRAEAELAVKKIAERIKTSHPQAAQEALEKLK